MTGVRVGQIGIDRYAKNQSPDPIDQTEQHVGSLKEGIEGTGVVVLWQKEKKAPVLVVVSVHDVPRSSHHSRQMAKQ